ncbi:MAG: thioredoxin family protein [Bacteroidota bacterium]|nr:thioredoxin family protein [Bacteroidota bacterium]
MIRLILIFSFILSFSTLQAQILKPASWKFYFSEKEVKLNGQVDLIFEASIDEDWYLYSTDFNPDLGPTVTTFSFSPNGSYQLLGGIKPVGAKKKYDEIWEGDITYFEKKALFRQTIKVLSEKLQVQGTVDYQVCTDVDGKCIPFEEPFSFEDLKITASFTNAAPGKEKAKAEVEVLPNTSSYEVPVFKDSILINERAPDADKVENRAPDLNVPLEMNQSYSDEAETSGPFALLGFMLVAFLAGLAALLTPCVYPMIPMTVSFFSNSSNTRRNAVLKALVYGFSIIAIYTLVGLVVSIFFGHDTLNFVSTHWLPNLLFFFIFLIFGISFLGLFEITLPSSLINKVDRESDKGGYYGTVFMAFTLALVSFSCTGPIVGSLLVESARGEVLRPILGMFSFSLAFALPFTLFAIFPEWLNNLPKSGGWLNSVKVVLGFIELALALKFLSIADQVYHWQLLDREVFLAIWIAIFSLMGFYLLGKIRLPHDSELKSIGVPRLLLALVTFAFIIYLVPGLFGAPLKSMAGLLPPMTTQDFSMNTSSAGSNLQNFNSICDIPKNPNNLKFPHGINGYFDYDQALACARAQNKPLFIDFTGHGCVNCRLMEAKVWSDPEVLKLLNEDFVMLALYVDEKTSLPESDWYTSAFDGKVKKTIGGKNADFQVSRFNNNAQPYYVILGHNEKVLVKPVAYESNISKFKDFLEVGIQNFKQRFLHNKIEISGL